MLQIVTIGARPSRRISHGKLPFSKLAESGWDCVGFHSYITVISFAATQCREPHQKCRFPWVFGPHLHMYITHGSLGPCESTSQTGWQSVQPFLHRSHTMSYTQTSSSHLALMLAVHAMRTNNTRAARSDYVAEATNCGQTQVNSTSLIMTNY